mmetsp:Transcript_94203/g.266118  ORF Transcript_94203/g.266118 Transcript_94203/m.266118 type:complete len:104 (+) Transcript_94203:151-462(+)
MRSYGGDHASPHRVGGVVSMLRAPVILMWRLLNGIEEGSWSGLLTRGDFAQMLFLGEAMFMVFQLLRPFIRVQSSERILWLSFSGCASTARLDASSMQVAKRS